MANHYTKKRYRVDHSDPAGTLHRFFLDIHQEIQKMEKRLTQEVKRLELDKLGPDEVPFVDFPADAVAEILVPVQTLWTRAQLLSCAWENQIREKVQQLGLPQSLRNEKRELEARIQQFRERWINDIGARILLGVRTAMLLPSQMPLAEEVEGPVNHLLARYFGDIMPDPKDWADPAAQTLFSLLNELGELTGQRGAVQGLIKAIKTLSI
jgi:hypothetical protein